MENCETIDTSKRKGKIKMRISERALAIEPSLTRQLFSMASQYDDVIDLTLGDPDIIPAEAIRAAAASAVMEGITRYSANAGLISARTVIADTFYEEYQLEIDPAENMMMTVGGMEGLYLALASIINPGDEVIIHAPYYVNYVQMVRMCGGVPVLIETDENNNFLFTLEDVERAISPKTVAMIINTPCNPTGQIINGKLLDTLSKILVEKDLLVISDEVYRTLVFEGEHESIITRPGMLERTIVIDSLSKRFAMTGYRIGFAVGPKQWIANMIKMQENVAACAPLPSQYAAIAAYSERKNNEELCNIFKERCSLMADAINNSKKIHCLKPVATFYLFVNIEKTGMNSLDFAYELLEKVHVAVAPGIAYGKKYDSYIRIACTLNKKILLEAADRILEFVNSLGE